MRKKLAIYIGEIGGAFQQIIMNVITTKANALGYDVIAICSYGSYNDDVMYADGEKSTINLPDPSIFDGIIVTEDLFDVPGMGDALYEKLKNESSCPVVYLRTQREGFYSILLENKASIHRMMRHFTDDHGFTDICFMSGKKGYVDASERLEAYYDIMNEKGIPVTEHMVFHGDFWREKGEEAVDWFMQGRDCYPEAIVCANDYMAISVCDELRKRGIRVPEDVCVSGFDFVEEAKNYEPTITSLEVDFAGMSARAVDIIDSVNRGNHEEFIQRMPANLILNRSCGCGEQNQIGDIASIITKSYGKTASMKRIMLLSIEYQDCFELREYMDVADKYRELIKSDKAYFCFVEGSEQGFSDVSGDYSFTDKMMLYRILDGRDSRTICHTKFDRRDLLPEEYWKEDEPNNLYFFTIHFKNTVYGYMVTEKPQNEWFDIFTQAYILNLANAIENGIVHTQIAKLEEIRALYQKDALTGIYNRRGFDKLVRDRFNSSKSTGDSFSIASIDMDNLKYINDNFGHAGGDKAIKLLAEVLESLMEEGEFCARVGGDEFSAVLNITGPERMKQFKDVFNSLLIEASATIDEFDLGASIGICEIAEDPGKSLTGCMQIADMRMYEDKKSRKANKAD